MTRCETTNIGAVQHRMDIISAYQQFGLHVGDLPVRPTPRKSGLAPGTEPYGRLSTIATFRLGNSRVSRRKWQCRNVIHLVWDKWQVTAEELVDMIVSQLPTAP
jgi:hypothetical protein